MNLLKNGFGLQRIGGIFVLKKRYLMPTFNFSLNPKRLLFGASVLIVFYFWRTNPMNLTNDKNIVPIIEQELKFKYLQTALGSLKGDRENYAQASAIENTKITVGEIKGKNSASSLINNILLVRVKYSIKTDAGILSNKIGYYELRFDPFMAWYIRRRDISAIFWKIAL